MFPTLNEVLWLALIVGVLVNWLVETWHFNWKDVAANILIVGLVWIITEYIIPITPQATGWQVVYVIFAAAVAFSPVEVFKLVKTMGLETIKSWAKNKSEQFTKKETIEVTKTTEIKEEPKQ